MPRCETAPHVSARYGRATPLNLSASDDIICSVGRLEGKTVMIILSRSMTLCTCRVSSTFTMRA
jgi:hypothetical protein